MKLSVLFVVCWIFVSNVASAKSEIKTYNFGSWDFAFDFNYFQATGSYSKSGGTFNNLVGSNDYKNYLFDIGARTALTRKWALYSTLEVGAAQSVSNNVSRSNSGLSYAQVGTDWIMYKGAFLIIPEASFTYPFSRNDLNGDAVPFSEGTMEASALVNIQFDFNKIHLAGFTGFIYRDDGRSSLLPYGAVAEMKFTNWTMGGDIKGYTSLGFDKNSDNDASRIAFISTTSGGAARYTAVNPALIEANAWAKIKTSSRWAFKFGFGSTLDGANTAAGWNAVAGMSFNLQPEAKSPPTDNERFHEQLDDGVDQKLFVPDDQPKTQAQPPDDSDGVVEYYPTPAPVKKKPVKKPPKVQEELDKTEMQIELKSVKKKKQK